MDAALTRSTPASLAPLRRAVRIWSVLACAAAAAFVVALSVGSSGIPAQDVVRLLLWPEDSAASQVVHALRLPRALAALAAGGLLAVAGALMQVLLRNPLADPYVLGLSSGAAAGALSAMLLGAGAAIVDAGAFGGALASVALVFAFANRDLARREPLAGHESSPRLLLTGVVLASGWTAIITVILVIAPEAKLRGMLFWLMGDLGGADAYGVALAALAIIVAFALPLARELNAMLRGHEVAHALGVKVRAVRLAVLVLASLATALAVTTAGTVGFIGLVVPHALRLVIGNDQRVLVPACALAGGTLLLLADTVARTALAPQQVPVGVITCLIGVPTFMWLLGRGRSAVSEILMELQRLEVAVAGRTLVSALSVEVRAGEVWALVGANGAGKTMLLRTLAGLRAPRSGVVRFGGRECGAWPAVELARWRTYLPQSIHDAFPAPVLDVVLMGRHPHLSRWQWEGPRDREIALEALADVDLAGFASRDVATLSGGERQRAAIAAILAQEARVLLLDEPVAHLDLYHQLAILARLARLASAGRSVMFSVHDPNLAARFATHVLLYQDKGRVDAGPIDAVLTEAALSRALRCQVSRARVGGRTVFLPAEGAAG